MKRRQFIKQLGIGAAGLSVLPFISCKDPQKNPNIIIFLVDDMGVMDTSVPFLTDEKGNPKKFPLNDFYKTPNMQKLAQKGIRFSNFYAQSVCSPTRASIITGQNSARHHTTTWIQPSSNNRGKFGPPNWNWEGLKKNDVTLPHILKNIGYRTIHVGKAHFGPINYDGSNPLNLGYEVNIGGDCWGRPRSYYGKDHYGNHTKYGDDLHHQVPHLEEYHGSETYLTEALTKEANKQIHKSFEEGKPFFLNMSHYAVHAPFMPDIRFEENYQTSEKSERAKSFATMIEGMDKSLGDIITQVRNLGVAENTLIFFLGDNGSDAPLGKTHDIACAAPLRGKKGTHYEGGIRVPFIASWVDSSKNSWQRKLPIASGEIQNQLGTIMDIFPTIVDLVDANTPNGHVVDGFNLKKQVSGNYNKSRPGSFLMHFPHGPHNSNYFTCFRQGDWKVIYHYYPEQNPAKVRYELFNIKNNISESENLAEINSVKLKEMINSMIEQLIKENAQYPINKNGEELKPIIPLD